mmetsp:Transcript_21412/g.30280  ORF Transcript_21412/g.30280 Transcript_21412/m.30280 type:complete len:138 (-) Transcript_21412:62-475(-)
MKLFISTLTLLFSLSSGFILSPNRGTWSRVDEKATTRIGSTIESASSVTAKPDVSFHPDNDYTADQMEIDLLNVLPSAVKLGVKAIGSIAKVDVTFPATKWSKGHHVQLSTFMDRSHIDELKTNIMRKYDENLSDDL